MSAGVAPELDRRQRRRTSTATSRARLSENSSVLATRPWRSSSMSPSRSRLADDVGHLLDRERRGDLVLGLDPEEAHEGLRDPFHRAHDRAQGAAR